MSSRLDTASPYALGLFRIVVGLLFTCHGLSTLFGAFGGTSQPAGTWPGWYAGLIQFVAGLFVLIGFGTRGAAFLSSGAMAFAYFKVHQPHALLPIQNGGEPAALFCWIMLLLIFTGPGALGLDHLLALRGRRTAGHDGTDGTSGGGSAPERATATA